MIFWTNISRASNFTWRKSRA